MRKFFLVVLLTTLTFGATAPLRSKDGPSVKTSKDHALQIVSPKIETTRVAVLTQPLSRGQEIKPEHIILKDMPISAKTANCFSTRQDLEGGRVNQRLDKGAILKRHNVHTQFDVPKGAIVTLVYQSKNLTIQARGASLQHKATVGQRVRVLPPYKKKGKYPLAGTLTSPTSVLIDAS